MSSPAVILGASGQVARSLKNELKNKNQRFVATSSRAESEHFLDLSQEDSIRSFFKEFQKTNKTADVYLPGAFTHVDRCETEKKRCYEINVAGPILVGKICADLGYRLCFYSSEYVFGEDEYEGGDIGPFRETDIPAPTSYYGKCKLETEHALMAIPDLHPLLIRTTMVFSWEKDGMNFFMQLYRHFEKIRDGEDATFRIPLDQVSTPTYAPALATASVELMDQ